MPSYKLYYFQLRGRAEAARMAFAYAGVDFEDIRLPGPTLMAGRADGSIPAPFNQFPVLEVDGVPIAQSYTILRFVAKLSDLYPKDAIQAAIAESIADQAADILQGWLALELNAAFDADAKVSYC
jgi:glutathione S-transferase